MADMEEQTYPDVAVVVPVRNEAENVGPLIEEIATALRGRESFETVFIDDGSDDGTLIALEALMADHPELRVLRHRKSCGQSSAIASGVAASRAAVIITMDGDGQNVPGDMLALLTRYRVADAADLIMVTGQRMKRQDTWLRRLSSRVANSVRATLLGDATLDTGCGLKVFSRTAFLEMPRFDHMHRFLPALMQRRGGQVVSVPVSHRPRLRGTSNYGVWNRLLVGVFDLAGVMWLQRRTSRPEIEIQLGKRL